MQRSPTSQGKCPSESDITHLLDLEPEHRGKRRRGAGPPSDTAPATTNKLDQILALIGKQNSRLDDLESHIRELKTQGTSIQSTNTGIAKSVENVTNQLSLMQVKIDSLEAKKQDMCIHLNKLEDKIERFEQSTVKTSVEIRLVPKQSKESKHNLYNLLKNLSSTLGHPLERTEVRDIYRQPSKVTDTKSTVVVEFSSTLTKTDFLSLAKQRNQITRLCTKDLGLLGEVNPIFISEHLTKRARHLHFLAREVARSCHYDFCWTANGQVYLRKEEGSSIVFVKSVEQLDEIKNKLTQ